MIILKKLYINPMVDLSYIFRRFHEILRDEYNSFCEYCTFVKDRYIIYNSEDLNISSIKLSFISDYPPAKSILGLKRNNSSYYLSNPNDAEISGIVNIFVNDCKNYDTCSQEEDIEKVRNNMSKIILGIKDDHRPMHILAFDGRYSIESKWDDPSAYGVRESKIILEANGEGIDFASFNGALNYIYGGRSEYQRELTAFNVLEKSGGTWKDNFRINYHMFGISKVISNEPATIVFWKDGTKTVVKCQEGDTYDLEKGILYAIIRKVYGEGRNYTNILNIIDESCETYCYAKANEAFWNHDKEKIDG